MPMHTPTKRPFIASYFTALTAECGCLFLSTTVGEMVHRLSGGDIDSRHPKKIYIYIGVYNPYQTQPQRQKSRKTINTAVHYSNTHCILVGNRSPETPMAKACSFDMVVWWPQKRGGRIRNALYQTSRATRYQTLCVARGALVSA